MAELLISACLGRHATVSECVTPTLESLKKILFEKRRIGNRYFTLAKHPFLSRKSPTKGPV